jgi:hypothetical protein
MTPVFSGGENPTYVYQLRSWETLGGACSGPSEAEVGDAYLKDLLGANWQVCNKPGPESRRILAVGSRTTEGLPGEARSKAGLANATILLVRLPQSVRHCYRCRCKLALLLQ